MSPVGKSADPSLCLSKTRYSCVGEIGSDDLARLFSLTNEYRSIKYDLRNMQVLMERLHNPQNSFRSVLIAGTNGKGSVAALLSAMETNWPR